MPRAARYHLSWVDEYGIYALRDADNNEPPLPFAMGSPEWFSWLSGIPSFAFTGKLGSITVRQETRGGAGAYWYAYRRHGNKMLKRYLGRTADLTFAHLEEVALHLTTSSVASPNQELPACDPSQEYDLAQGRYQTPARDASGPSPALQTDNHPGTAPHALHKAHSDAHDPLLATKLHLPRPRARLVSRSHLTLRLQQGVTGPLTLVSAPAGYGKTTLLAQWRASTPTPVAWLSLESEDNEPTRFFTYLIAALQTLDPHLGARAHTLLGLPQPASPETVLTLLTNDLLSWQGEDFVLVLDDYHVITVPAIHHALTHLVEHLPPQMHLILTTRSDPPLPLARLRARGHLTELRAADLRFGAAEASMFLAEVMGLHLSQEDARTLQSRTEGWIAGLQLAALSLQGRTDVVDALAAFNGSHRFVLDYLSEEVLSRQPVQVQAFLLHSSILERLSGSLCDAVTGSQGSQAILESLERANLFVVALDDVRGWYRYHHLFADLLRSHLQEAMPALPPELHHRASQWYEEHDLILEAFRHARLSLNLERPIRLIEQHTYELVLRGQAHTVINWLHVVLSWLQTIPDELFQMHPRLCLSQVLLLLLTGQLPEALMRLEVAKQAASRVASGSVLQALLNEADTFHAYILFLQGDLKSSVALAERALDQLDETPVDVRDTTRLIAAHHALVSGDARQVGALPRARRASAPEAVGDVFGMDVFLHLTGLLLQACLLRLQGRLRQAAATFEQMAQAQGDHEGALIHPGYGFGLGDLCYEWNDLDRAELFLQQGREALGGPLTLAGNFTAQGYATLARLQQARNKPSLAFALLEEFVELAKARRFVPGQLAFASACRAQLALMQGNLAEAVSWAEVSGLSTEDDLAYPREREYLIFARVRTAQGRLDPARPFLAEALRLLERLRADAERSARVNSLLEILVLQALALFASSVHRTQALTTLEQALLLGEQEGYIRLFVDEGQPMVALLRQAYARGIATDYVSSLLLAFDEQVQASSSEPGALVEPLTERERDIFRLLVRGLSNAEIARELIITVGTVKRHVNSIYGKLGVSSRAQAIARAQALRLL